MTNKQRKQEAEAAVLERMRGQGWIAPYVVRSCASQMLGFKRRGLVECSIGIGGNYIFRIREAAVLPHPA